MMRYKMGAKHSKSLFRHTAGARHVHPKNAMGVSMRGGIRL